MHINSTVGVAGIRGTEFQMVDNLEAKVKSVLEWDKMRDHEVLASLKALELEN